MNDESIGTLFERLLDRVADRVADRVMQRLQGTGSDYVDQTNSPLGPRRHISAIRSGRLSGKQIGRLYLALSSDIEAYIAKHPTADDVASKENEDEVDALAAELGLHRQGKGGSR